MNETLDPVEDAAELTPLDIIAEDRAKFVATGDPTKADARGAEYDEALRAGREAWGERQDSTRDLAKTQVNLAQIPEKDAQEVFERVDAAERTLIAPNLKESEYREGGADHDDEVVVFEGGSPRLITAEHATDVVRKATGKLGGADHGTGGLAKVLHEDTDATAIVPIGRQTGNTAVDVEHPVKDAMKLYLPTTEGYLSVHGMAPGKADDVFGRTEVHAILGLGSEPNDMTIEVARLLREYGKELGLKVQLSTEEEYLFIQGNPPIAKRDDEGNVVWKTLGGRGDTHATNVVNRTKTAAGEPIPAMQIEMTRMLRLLPDLKEERTTQHKVMGVYLGYLLTKKAVELMVPQG